MDTDTIQQATEVVEAAAPASAIAEYNVTAVALAELRQRLAGKVYASRGLSFRNASPMR